MTLAVTETTFEEEVLKSEIPVLVDFWAEWCGPCRMIGPIVEELGKEYEGRLKVAKIDVQNNNNVASKYGIMSIPALLFFKNGEVVDQIIGAVPKKAVEDRLTRVLG
jgi:thioredoxin 1